MGLRTYPPSAWRREGTPTSNYRVWLDSVLHSDGLTVADYDATLGITGTTNASAWANQIGIAGPLLQASGANQPIVLPWTGTNYAYLGTVADNNFTTPSAAANQITGDIELIYSKVLLSDWTPAVIVSLPGKWAGAGAGGYIAYINTTGTISFLASYAVSGNVTVTSDNATGFTDGMYGYIKVTRVKSSGDVTFWTSTDGVSWSQNGAVKTAAANEAFTTTAALVAGGKTAMTNPGILHISRFTIANSIGGSPVVDFNPALMSETTTNGATFAAATGETWTLNNTGAVKAQIVGSAQLLGDGTGDFMQVTATIPAPYAIISVEKALTWTSGDVSFDGKTANSFAFQQITGTPQGRMHDGLADSATISPVLNTYNIITASQAADGSATLQLNSGAPVAAAMSATALAGITAFADGAGANFWNGQKKRMIVLSEVPSAGKLAQIIALLNAIYGL